MNDTARIILNKINDAGFKAYLVGGYPRDLYLGRSSMDFDICTNATPKDLKEIFGDIRQHLEQYGSVTVYLNDLRFEITTLSVCSFLTCFAFIIIGIVEGFVG